MKDYKRKNSNEFNENRFLIEEEKSEISEVTEEDSWKCPECGESVKNNFDICWNCENLKPEIIENKNLETKAEFESEKPKEYWKCPDCSEIVENNFELCWNCQCLKPENPENPTIDEIAEYQQTVDEDIEFNENVNDYWKCPKCGEVIDNTFDLCWNCKQIKIEGVERPSFSEMIENKSKKKSPNFINSGTSLVAVGIFLIYFGDYYNLGRYIFGTLFIIIGIVIFGTGIIRKK